MDQLEIFEKGRTLRNGYRVSQRRSLHLLITRSEGKKKSLTDAKALFCMQDKLNAIYLCSGGLEHKSRAGSTRCSEQSSSENRFMSCDWWVRTGPREN